MKKSKENQSKIMLKKQKGITLIALVITIVVLIILATITINFAFGDNGLINMAELARDEATNSTAYETYAMKNLVAYMNEYRSEINGGGGTEPEEDTTPPTVIITEGEITENSIAISVNANDPESGLAGENAYVYYLNGAEQTRNNSSSYTFSGLTAETAYTIKVEVINGVGIKGEDSTTITTKAKPGISSDEVHQNPATYYGAEVKGYSCTSKGVEKWRIFYADESNIYLIADDYIASEYAPKSTGNHSLSVYSGSNYRLYFNANVLNDYSGASWINSNSKAKSWIGKYLNNYGSSTNTNIEAVAYMMDTNVWSTYAGSQAEYAIGGPTLELFCASYQDTHPSKYINNRVENSSGYYVKWSNEADSAYTYYVNGLAQNDFDSIYIKSDISNAYGMWLASPSATGSNHLFIADCNGNVSYGYYDYDLLGLRPLVCLKSSVQLKAQGDGTYAIIQ